MRVEGGLTGLDTCRHKSRYRTTAYQSNLLTANNSSIQEKTKRCRSCPSARMQTTHGHDVCFQEKVLPQSIHKEWAIHRSIHRFKVWENTDSTTFSFTIVSSGLTVTNSVVFQLESTYSQSNRTSVFVSAFNAAKPLKSPLKSPRKLFILIT